jgi:2-dehydropantoate 2-reductase
MGCNVELDPEKQSAFARQSPHIPSIAQDAVAGRLPEIDAQLIAVQNLAREKGVKTPTMDLLIALVRLRLKNSGWHFGESTPSASS